MESKLGKKLVRRPAQNITLVLMQLGGNMLPINNPYVFQKNDQWYCMLPNRTYKRVPYINWVEDVDWCVIYYRVFDSLLNNTITDIELQNWDLEKILEVAADIKL